MNKRQRKIQALKVYYKRALTENKKDGLYSDFDSRVIFALNSLEIEFADKPETGYHRTDEEKELSFLPVGTIGTVGCCTIPCCGGKLPYEKEPCVPCVIHGTMCGQSPIESMREGKKFSEIEAGLKEQKRLAKNKRARELYAQKKNLG